MKSIEIIREAVELTLISARIEGEQPGSLLITAEVEEGKTHLVSQYMSNSGVAYLADATAYGIVEEYLTEIRSGRIRHLIFPELIRPLERQKETASSFVAFLGELIEEGIKEIQTYNTRIRLPTPVKAGVIACIARGSLKDRIPHWNSTGFLSRFLAVSYSYGDETAEQVRTNIIEGKSSEPRNLVLPEQQKVHVPEEIARGLASMAVGLAQGLYPPLHGFRMQKHLQRLAMASALRAGRDSVNKDDFVKIHEITNYINLDYTPL